jgi:hypothetical protein
LHRQPVIQRFQELLAFLPQINAEMFVLFFGKPDVRLYMSFESLSSSRLAVVVEIQGVSQSAYNLA